MANRKKETEREQDLKTAVERALVNEMLAINDTAKDIKRIRNAAMLTAEYYKALIDEGLTEQQALYLTGIAVAPKN